MLVSHTCGLHLQQDTLLTGTSRQHQLCCPLPCNIVYVETEIDGREETQSILCRQGDCGNRTNICRSFEAVESSSYSHKYLNSHSKVM